MKFNPPYSISGESGKTLGPQPVELEMIGASGAVLTLRSLDADSLEFFITDPAPTDPIPEDKQKINLFDGSGIRVFSGEAAVTKSYVDGVLGISVTAYNAYRKLQQTRVTELTYPAGALMHTTLANVLTLAQADGLGIRAGDISPSYAGPPFTFREATYDDILGDILRNIPDAATRVDYSSGGEPRLNIQRRSASSTQKIDVQLEGNETTELNLEPLPELRAQQIRVLRLARNSANTPSISTEIAGDPNAPAAARQTINVASVDLSGGVPSEFNEFLTVQTLEANSSALYELLDPQLASIKAQFGTLTGAAASVIALWSGATFSTRVYDPITLPALRMFNADGSVLTSASYPVISTTPNPPEWLIERLGLVPITITGTWRVNFIFPNGTSPVFTDLYRAISETIADKSYWAYGPPETDTSRNWPGWRSFTVRAWRSSISIPSPTVYFRAPLIATVNPPLGFAENLYRAQDWLPYRGRATFAPGGEVPLPATPISAIGAWPEWRTAGALARETTLNLTTGTAATLLGPPPRADFLRL